MERVKSFKFFGVHITDDFCGFLQIYTFIESYKTFYK
jgi:hypothetical protein